MSEHWLLNHIIADVERLRTDCGLPEAFAEIHAALTEPPALVIDRPGAPGNFTAAFDLVIVDRPERLDSRARLDALRARRLPLRTCSLYAVTDSPDEAAPIVARFEQRLKRHTFSFASQIVHTSPDPELVLEERELSPYISWLIDQRLDEVLQAARTGIKAIPQIDQTIHSQIKADIARERKWIRERFAGLRSDLSATLRGSEPALHARSQLEAVARDLAERYGVAAPALVDVEAYVRNEAKRGRGVQALEIGIEAILAIKTLGVSLLRRLIPILEGKAARDPRDEALFRLFDRDLERSLEHLTRRLDVRLAPLASARAAAGFPAYAELQRWRGIVGRALALKKRMKAMVCQ